MSPARALTSMAPWSRTDIRVARAMCVCVFACGQLETSRLPLPLSELKAQAFLNNTCFYRPPDRRRAHVSDFVLPYDSHSHAHMLAGAPTPEPTRPTRIADPTGDSHIAHMGAYGHSNTNPFFTSK